MQVVWLNRAYKTRQRIYVEIKESVTLDSVKQYTTQHTKDTKITTITRRRGNVRLADKNTKDCSFLSRHSSENGRLLSSGWSVVGRG